MYIKLVTHEIDQTIIDQLWVYFRKNDYPQSLDNKSKQHFEERTNYTDDAVEKYMFVYATFWKPLFLDFAKCPTDSTLKCFMPFATDNAYIINKKINHSVSGNVNNESSSSKEIIYTCQKANVGSADIDTIGKTIGGKWSGIVTISSS